MRNIKDIVKVLSFLRWQSTSSSNIDAINYKPKKEIMIVRFNSGDEYEYENVPEVLYLEILNASSVGSKFYWTVRDDPSSYPFRKVN